MQIKEWIWRFAILSARLLPKLVRKNLCYLFFAVDVERKSDGLRGLLQIEGSLQWYINQAAIRNENGLHPKHRLMKYHDFFANRICKGETVLDIGCGNGALANSLAIAGAKVTAVDINEESIRVAKNLYHNADIHFIHANIYDLDDSPEVETIVMSNVLEHIEDRVGLIRFLSRKNNLRRWLIRVPMVNRHWTVSLKKEMGLQHYCDPTHCIEYTEDSFREEMEAAGLKVDHLQVNWGEIWCEVSDGNNYRSDAGL